MARFVFSPNRMIDANGIADAGQIFFYETGTTNPVTIYSNAALTVERANPVVVNAGAPVPPIYINTAIQTRAVVQDSSGNTLDDIDPVFSLLAPSGSGEVGFIQSGAGAVASTVQAELRNMAVTPQQFLAPGESISVDAGPAIRRAQLVGKPIRFPVGTYIVAPDPASENDGGIGVGVFGWCLRFLSNTTLIFEEGAVIKAADGIGNWCRVVQVGRLGVPVTNFRSFGEMNVDGNVANISPSNNEHMHGVILFDCSDSYIERIVSQNARGDNIFIGGTDNTVGCRNLYIGSVSCKTAGRKNIAVGSVRSSGIGAAYLDNTLGGAMAYGGVADDTDGHSLDFEPDNFTGAVPIDFHIGELTTIGSGNDFTAGTTAAIADNAVMTIGTFRMIVTPRAAVAPWLHYACTISCDELHISGLSSVAPISIIQYAARLRCKRMSINGTGTAAVFSFLIAQVSNNVPRVEIGALDGSYSGGGFEIRDGDVEVGTWRLTTSGAAFWARGLSSTASVQTRVRIGMAEWDNVGAPSGASYAAYISKAGTAQPYVNISYLRFRDNRSPALTRIILADTGTSPGISIGVVENETAVPLFTFNGADKFYKVAGGGGAPAQYVCTGTPEAMITAPIGSKASRTDGAATTTFYVKESGTGNTGWVAK